MRAEQEGCLLSKLCSLSSEAFLSQGFSARSSEMDFLRLQEESASPALKVRKEKTTEKEEKKEVVKEKEEKYCPRELTNWSQHPTL